MLKRQFCAHLTIKKILQCSPSRKIKNLNLRTQTHLKKDIIII